MGGLAIDDRGRAAPRPAEANAEPDLPHHGGPIRQAAPADHPGHQAHRLLSRRQEGARVRPDRSRAGRPTSRQRVDEPIAAEEAAGPAPTTARDAAAASVGGCDPRPTASRGDGPRGTGRLPVPVDSRCRSATSSALHARRHRVSSPRARRARVIDDGSLFLLLGIAVLGDGVVRRHRQRAGRHGPRRRPRRPPIAAARRDARGARCIWRLFVVSRAAADGAGRGAAARAARGRESGRRRRRRRGAKRKPRAG